MNLTLRNKAVSRAAVWTALITVTLLTGVSCRTGTGQTAATQHVPVKMVWAGHHGGGPNPASSVQWIDRPETLESGAFQRGPFHAIMGRSEMDWGRYGLVWIRMGQKPTGGYGLRLASAEAMVTKRTVVLTVRWREPPKGAFVTQMITSPCMALKIPRGDYNEIVIKDQDGRVRAVEVLPPPS